MALTRKQDDGSNRKEQGKKGQSKIETGQKRNTGKISFLDKVFKNKNSKDRKNILGQNPDRQKPEKQKPDKPKPGKQKLDKQKPGRQKLDKQKPDRLKPIRRDVAKKDIVLVKEDKKDLAGKEAKKTYPVKKEKVNYIELAQKFIKGAYGELKKVNWPSRKELIIYTVVVVVAVLFVGALLWIFDSALSTVLRFVISR